MDKTSDLPGVRAPVCEGFLYSAGGAAAVAGAAAMYAYAGRLLPAAHN
jgi:hypothetical protein